MPVGSSWRSYLRVETLRIFCYFAKTRKEEQKRKKSKKKKKKGFCEGFKLEEKKKKRQPLKVCFCFLGTKQPPTEVELNEDNRAWLSGFYTWPSKDGRGEA